VVDQVKADLATLPGSADEAGVEIQSVGPSWGSQISRKALEALIIFLVLVTVYISFRFEWKMAVAALAALAHDLIITAGVYSLVGFQVVPATVIATLTILGYSLYDTVVVFDKIQENTTLAAQVARQTYADTVNDSLNQVLMRSINTSLASLIPVGSLLVVGLVNPAGGTLKDFALALFVGLLSGTYSSVFFAAPILVPLKESEARYQAIRGRIESRATRVAVPSVGAAAPRADEEPEELEAERATAGAGAAGAATGSAKAKSGQPARGPAPKGQRRPTGKRRSGGGKRRR
jgi:preprotein translocase subunit SecF